MKVDQTFISEGPFTKSWEVTRRGTKICIEFEFGSEYAAAVYADRLKELWEGNGFTLRGDDLFLLIKKPRK